MELDIQKFLAVFLILLDVSEICSAKKLKKDKALYCGACLAIVEEMGYAIASVDRKKTIQIGSFRVDAHGNQDLREVPYARSDVHLTEEFEKVCNKMYNHGLARRDDKRKKDVYIRKYSADGTMVSSDSADFDEDTTKRLKYTCEQILEDFEEDMMKLLKKESPDMDKLICVEELGFCKEKDVTARLWAQAEAVMAGMKEKADEGLEKKDDQDEDTEAGDAGEDITGKDAEFREPIDDDLANLEEENKIVMTDGEIPADDKTEL